MMKTLLSPSFEDCLSVANSPVGGKWNPNAAPAYEMDARSLHENIYTNPKHWTQFPWLELQTVPGNRASFSC
jgi:hypothetical protein